VPYDEFEIKRHMDYLNMVAQQEEGENYEPVQLYQIVSSSEEAERHNKQRVSARRNVQEEDSLDISLPDQQSSDNFTKMPLLKEQEYA